MADFADALTDALRRLREARSAYAISGSVAKAIYGRPTLSKDVDVVVEDVEPFQSAFRPDYRALDAETFEHPTGFVVELYKATTPMEREMLKRRQERTTPDGQSVDVLDPTDWAALKLREAKRAPPERLRHLGDVQQVHQVQGYDCKRLREMAKEFGAEKELQDTGVCELE